RAAQQGVQVAAHNVANLATPDAQRLQLQRGATEHWQKALKSEGYATTRACRADVDSRSRAGR
ncbi:hypothetical protein C7E25_15600, partial [Stenotrophomonas maltophilia]